jgi:hypothetical protein
MTHVSAAAVEIRNELYVKIETTLSAQWYGGKISPKQQVKHNDKG